MASYYDLHVETEIGNEAASPLKLAGISIAISIAILVGGFFWLGSRAMLDINSPEFFPVPHFFALAPLLIALFAGVSGYGHAQRFQMFGKSSIYGNKPQLGEVFAGVLKLTKSDNIAAPMTLQLRCDWRHRIEYQDGENSKMGIETKWQQSQQAPSGGALVGIPFRFLIPANALPSGRHSVVGTGAKKQTSGHIVWVLKASSKRPGLDYVAEFEVPVRAAGAANSASDDEDDE
jgi:hypothetical protein